MKSRRLKSGRIIFDTYSDQYGNPKFIEYYDSRSGSRRIAFGSYWDGNERAKTIGQSVSSIDEFAELLEDQVERFQMCWFPDKRNGKLIMMGKAFPWLPPQVGDQMEDLYSGQIFTVVHVPKAPQGFLWNLSLLLDAAPTLGMELAWVGEARDRNLVDFGASSGKPSTPTKGEDTTGDVGTSYSKILRPSISYSLLRTELFSTDGHPFGSKKELRAQIREQYNDPYSPQRVITILGQRTESLVRFECFHPRAGTSYALARWFKDFISRRTPSLEANGIPRILFWSQGDRARTGKPGDDTAAHDVVYFIVMEELSVREDSAIRKMNLISRVTQREYSDLGLTGVTEPGNEGYLTPYTGAFDESGNYLVGDNEIQDLRATGS